MNIPAGTESDKLERGDHLPHVVIVGGGFGGVAAARALRRAHVRVTLIDRRNHHLFQPLLYQVATATLSPADIASPIRLLLSRQRNAAVLLAEVTDIATAEREVVLANGERIAYDFLILATGATHHYFGHPEWAEFAPGLKTVEDGTEIRRRYLLAFEAAEQEKDPERVRSLLTFVVVGAGPTGVELAGAMAETARHSLERDFRQIDPTAARIVLLEGGPRVLAGYAPELAAKAERALEEMGVELRTEAMVTGVDADAVYVGEERIPARNAVWAAGVRASRLGGTLGVPTDAAGRVRVEPDLSIPGHPEIQTIGDLALLAGEDGEPLPGVAQVAKQQGKHAAENVIRAVRGEALRPFRYSDRGNMATVGRRKAVLESGKFRSFGWFAWVAWLVVHILYLSTFQNRLAVFVQWAWSYVTWQRGARLITGRLGPELAAVGEPLGGALPASDDAGE
ncbi:NAD(P)/FAD-dependent oxidoreductase [soil metagenome]